MNEDIELKQFKNENNQNSCYVCFVETDNKSPCLCESKICIECYKNVIKNNGINCTICKTKFDDKLIDINITIEEIEDRIDRYNKNIDDIKLLFILLLIFLLTPLFGIIFRLILNLKLNNYFSIENFLFGLIIWVFIISLISIINFFITLLIIFYNLT